MWFFDFAPYWRVDKTLKYRLMFLWALFVGAGGIFITGAGVSGAFHLPGVVLISRTDVRVGSRYQDQLCQQQDVAVEL